MVTWTLYESITQDFHSRIEQSERVHMETGDTSMHPEVIERMPSWPVNAKLDRDVGEFRSYQANWTKRRMECLRFIPKNQLKLPLPQMSEDPDRDEDEDLLFSVGVRWRRRPYAEAYPDRVVEMLKGDLKLEVPPPTYEPSDLAALSYKMVRRWDPSPSTDSVMARDNN